MAKLVTKSLPTKRFGVRYGRTVKEKFAKCEMEHRGEHKCPYCALVKVKRVAVGIWQCNKCNSKFTGRAYSFGKPISIEETAVEETADAKGEE